MVENYIKLRAMIRDALYAVHVPIDLSAVEYHLKEALDLLVKIKNNKE